MDIFNDYARYYNLLYSDKDYSGEVDFVLQVVRQHGGTPHTVLDLGCGTGRHALEMTRNGVSVVGVDMSNTMLDLGAKTMRRCNAGDFSVPLPALHQGDVRTVRLGQHFDAVVSLFHVMSYQTSEEDAVALLETAKAHLKPGGLFLFDFWYGPGVLTDPPTERTKTIEDAHTHCVRKAKPTHRVNDNSVDVHYAVRLTDKDSKTLAELRETHCMRYWFMPELRYLARQCGFRVVDEGAWLAMATPSVDTWNAWMICR